MNPKNQQKREIKFSSPKNNRLLVVNSEAAMSVASKLESDSNVVSYSRFYEHAECVADPDSAGYDRMEQPAAGNEKHLR